MSNTPHFRTIVYEEAAEQAGLWLSRRYRRFRNMLDGWEFRLSRAPTAKAEVVPGSNPVLYWVKTPRWPNLPQLTFVFTFDEHTVSVKEIRVIEPPVPPSD